MEPTRIIILISVLSLFLIVRVLPFRIWMMAKMTEVKISLWELTRMKIRGVKTDVVVRSLIESQKAGLGIRKDELVAHHLANGDLDNVVHGMIYAKQNNRSMAFQEATQLDQAGFNVLDTVNMKIESSTNNPGKTSPSSPA